MSASTISRRSFLGAGTGIILAFTLPPKIALSAASGSLPKVGSLRKHPRLDAWLRIAPEGFVTVFTGKVEIGQGILTAIAQIAADELDVDLSRIRVMSGNTDHCPDEGWTAGSLSIEDSGLAVRYAAAEARHILLELAAERLAEPAHSLSIIDGTVRGTSGRSVTYWTLARDNRLYREASMVYEPKRRERRRLIGTSVPRIDLPGKFCGERSFLQDIVLPGMMHGRVLRPPSPGARLLELDESKVRALKGVRAVVRDGSFVGVIAEQEEQAIAARQALSDGSRWSEDAGWSLRMQDLPAQLKKLPHRTLQLAQGQATAAVVRRLTATYSKPFVAHASIGPSAAIAWMKDGRLSVWTHSQAVFPLRRALSKVLQLPLNSIHIEHAQGSGCYGHNGQDDVALDAALLARALPGTPVRVQWMRDDEFGWEPYGSAMTMQVNCGLAADGTIAEWRYEFWTGAHAERADIPPGQPNLLAAEHLSTPHARPGEAFEVPLPAGGGSRNAVPYYSFPAQVTEHLVAKMPFRTSSLRSLGAYANVFAIESMMDEAAAAAHVDPIAFRMRHLQDERARRVLNTLADAAKWRCGERRTECNGRGVAFSRYKNLQAYIALVADVAVDRATGAIRVQRITAAVDAGEVINPDGLTNQIEGGIIQALSWTLKEQVSFDQRRVTSVSWADYPILTFSEVPDIAIVLVETPGHGPLGVGEVSVPPVGAAVANAVASAVGVRLRDLPFTPERVRAAIAASSQLSP
jgi:CO/xanthine dehydrogenase Mo-binding subunit